ncbi:MAG: TolC family protein [Desulfobacterales bacterium]
MNLSRIKFVRPLFAGIFVLLSTAAAAENGGEISLEKAYRIALEENEQVRISRQDLRKAEADITSATSNLYPQISARGAYTREREIRNENG